MKFLYMIGKAIGKATGFLKGFLYGCKIWYLYKHGKITKHQLNEMAGEKVVEE